MADGGKARYIYSGGGPGIAAGFGTPTISVVTGEPGTEASAVINASGPDTAKVFDFDFTIPRGDKGEKGRDGIISARILTATATLSGWMGDTAPYTQDITIEGITSTEVPYIDVKEPTKENSLEFNKITKVSTIDRGLHLEAFVEKPTKDLELTLYIIPSVSTGGAVDSVNGQTGVVVLGADDINFSDGENFQQKLDTGKLKGKDGKIEVKLNTVIALANGWTGEQAPFTQEILIKNMVATDVPYLDLTEPTIENGKEFNKITEVFAEQGKLVLKALNEKPTLDLSLEVYSIPSVATAGGSVSEETVRNTLLTGIQFSDNTKVIETDNILIGIGKLQAQLDNLIDGEGIKF